SLAGPLIGNVRSTINALAPIFRFDPHLYLASPWFSLNSLFESAYFANAWNYWLSLVVVQSLAWLFLALAAWALPRSWQDKAAETKKPHSWFGGKPARMAEQELRRKQRRAALLEINPILWLASRGEQPKVYLWLVVGLVIGLGAFGGLLAKEFD